MGKGLPGLVGWRPSRGSGVPVGAADSSFESCQRYGTDGLSRRAVGNSVTGAQRAARAWRGPIWLGLSVAGFIVTAWFVIVPGIAAMGFDAYAYWTVDIGHVYARSFGQLQAFGAFRYAPPVALVMAPLSLLPWPVYLAVWTASLVGALTYVARRWTLAACAFVGVGISLYLGNVDLLMAAAIVGAMRWPALWAIPILLKPTSAIGLLWYAGRREWRNLAIVLGVLAAACLPTIVLFPTMWGDWIRMLRDNLAIPAPELTVPALVRYPVAAALMALAVRSNRPWLIGIAVGLSQPVFGLRSATVAISALGLARGALDDHDRATSADAVENPSDRVLHRHAIDARASRHARRWRIRRRVELDPAAGR